MKVILSLIMLQSFKTQNISIDFYKSTAYLI